MTKSFPAVAVLALIALLAITGCGSSSNNSSGSSGGGAYGGGEKTTSKPAASTTASTGAPITVGTAKGVGKVLVDSNGLTLYYFQKDQNGESTCYGPCEAGWPPLTTEGAPQAGEGAMASKMGTTKRKDGTVQVTYNNWPLYTFVEDKKPGEANGNDVSAFGAQWYALKGSGEEAGD